MVGPGIMRNPHDLDRIVSERNGVVNKSLVSAYALRDHKPSSPAKNWEWRFIVVDEIPAISARPDGKGNFCIAGFFRPVRRLSIHGNGNRNTADQHQRCSSFYHCFSLKLGSGVSIIGSSEKFIELDKKQTVNAKTVKLLIIQKCILITVLLAGGCNRKEPPLSLVPVDNPRFIENTAFSSFEDLSSPKFSTLREKYQLDTVFHGEEDEFKRMLLLRDWIRKVVQISDFEDSYPGGEFAEGILDAALQGHGFHCGHYMVVQNAVMNSYGYVTRCIGAGPGVKGGPDGHHGINEIWSNKFHKWFLSDAKYNHHFEKDGIPLSALEVRDEYLKNKASDILLVKGPLRVAIEGDREVNKKGEVFEKSKERYAQTYTWIEWESVNDRFTHWPDNSDALAKLNMYADDYFKNNTWIWDGKPHWAYNTENMILISDRDAIEWTPNTIKADVTLEGDVASIALTSNTPNLKTYQFKKADDAEWKDVSNPVSVTLANAENELSFRSVNLAGVAGAPYKVIVTR